MRGELRGVGGPESGAGGRERTSPIPDPGPPTPLSSSLVIQTSFLGDVVLTTPLLRALAERGPVDVVTTPAAAALLERDPSVRRLFAYDKRGAHAGLRGLRRVAREIREHARADHGHGYAAAYLAQGSLRSAALACMVRARARVGFEDSAGRPLYTHRVPRRTDRHHAERLWRLAHADAPDASPPPEQLRPRLYPGPQHAAAVDALLGLHDARPIVVLAPGSAWGTKRWPYYPELARRLAPRARIAVVGGSAEREAARELVAAAERSDSVDATAGVSLLAAAELIGRARAIVTNDSLPQHLASAMDTPTLTIFGPTVPEFGFGPLARRSAVAGLDELPCRPCHHHGPPRCPLGHWRCMRDLDADRVEHLLLSILD